MKGLLQVVVVFLWRIGGFPFSTMPLWYFVCKNYLTFLTKTIIVIGRVMFHSSANLNYLGEYCVQYFKNCSVPSFLHFNCLSFGVIYLSICFCRVRWRKGFSTPEFWDLYIFRYLDDHARFYRQTIILGFYSNPGNDPCFL